MLELYEMPCPHIHNVLFNPAKPLYNANPWSTPSQKRAQYIKCQFCPSRGFIKWILERAFYRVMGRAFYRGYFYGVLNGITKNSKQPGMRDRVNENYLPPKKKSDFTLISLHEGPGSQALKSQWAIAASEQFQNVNRVALKKVCRGSLWLEWSLG